MNDSGIKPQHMPTWPRFSLRTMMLATLFLGMALAIVLLTLELIPLRAEVQQLRNEAGYLTIDDPTKIHAIRVMTTETGTWRFRVWVPDGPLYYLRMGDLDMFRSQSVNGTFYLLPGLHDQADIGPGEHRIDVIANLVKDDSENQTFTLSVLVDGFRCLKHDVPLEKRTWLEALVRDNNFTWRCVGFTKQTGPPRKPFELLVCSDPVITPDTPLVLLIEHN